MDAFNFLWVCVCLLCGCCCCSCDVDNVHYLNINFDLVNEFVYWLRERMRELPLCACLLRLCKCANICANVSTVIYARFRVMCVCMCRENYYIYNSMCIFVIYLCCCLIVFWRHYTFILLGQQIKSQGPTKCMGKR